MSPRPIALNPDIKRLIDDGYEVEVRGNGYLAIHAIPYVTAQRTIAYGTIVTDLNENLGELLPQRDHQVWFSGNFPCHRTGAPIEAIRNSSNQQQLWDGFFAQHRFSNKPLSGSYPDYYSKMTSYIRILSNEARAIDPGVTPCTFKVIPPMEGDTVFRYHDSASSRADILAVSGKLAMGKVAIIGLGGTGAYILDLVAKTPPREIHLFDGDVFLQHNAFRSPGAATEETLSRKLPKVAFYAQVYDAMRRGIVPHPKYLTDQNIGDLAGFDFAFVCVDKGPARRLISSFLQAHGTPFIDVGMALAMVSEEQNLIGTCRATLSTPAMCEHFSKHVPMMDDLEEDMYRKNIQVADMNALNAALAVIHWKQFCNFYQNQFQAHHVTYSVNSQSLTRDVMPGGLEG
jgi:molybdopterin/thiamine biosynthesis adenylyltransferase